MQVEEYLRHDDRAVLPLGSTEQHSHLRLTVDCILPERVAAEAAEPLGVPVFPVVAYGVTPYFREFPGSISLRVETHLNVVRDILDSMAHSGFRRILIVNGHGGNGAVQQFAQEWVADHAGCRVIFYNWWNAPKTWAKVQATDPVASHGSWMENFPWTRLPNVELPTTPRAMVDAARVATLDPVALRKYLGDGNFGGSASTPGRGHARDLEGRRGGDARRARRLVGQRAVAAHIVMRALVWGAGAIGGTLGAHCACRARHHARRHRARARRRRQSRWTSYQRTDRGIQRARARLHAGCAGRRVGYDRARDEGASHGARGARARAAPERGWLRDLRAEWAQRARDRRSGWPRSYGGCVRELRRGLHGAGGDSVRRTRRRCRGRDRRPHHAACAGDSRELARLR